MSSMIDLLLGAGDEITERPEEELEVSRLSKLLGAPFLMQAHALTMKEIGDAPSGDDRGAHIILAGISDPDFRNEALRRKYTPPERKTPLTPVELIQKLLLPGEVMNTYNSIMDLSGFGSDAVERIEKN